MKGHDLLPNINYDEIEELKLLGKGGYAEVFLGRYKTESTEKLFAIKVFKLYDDLQNDLTKEDVKSEIRMLKMIADMPQIPDALPKYYGYRTKKKKYGKIYKVYMKYEKSVELKEFFKEHIPSFSEFKFIVRQLILTCAFLQNKELCHQDLKDQNILIKQRKNSKDLKVTLIDFGIARIIRNNLKTTLNRTKHELTNLGTPQFFSPEKRKVFLDGEEKIKINHFKSDVYSLGIVLLNLSLDTSIRWKAKYKEKEFKEEIQAGFEGLTKKYGVGEKKREFYIHLVKSMLEFDPEKRPDFINLMCKIEDFERKEVKVEKIIFLMLGAKNLRSSQEDREEAQRDKEKSQKKEKTESKEKERSESLKRNKKKQKKEERIKKSKMREKSPKKDNESEEEEEKDQIKIKKEMLIQEKNVEKILKVKKPFLLIIKCLFNPRFFSHSLTFPLLYYFFFEGELI